MLKNKKTLIILLIVFTIIMLTANIYAYRKKEIKLKNLKNENLILNNDFKTPIQNLEKKITENNAPKKSVPLKYNSEGVCILMYHSIGYEKNNGLRMPQKQFREQMKYIKDNGYTTLTLDELYNFFAKNKPIPRKSVVITLDDGYADNYIYAYPILKEFNLNATIFVITNKVDKNKEYLTSKELKDLQKNGIDIESHTVNYVELNSMSYNEQLKTLKESKIYLEKVLDKKVNYISYPVGKYNNDTIKAAKEAGYTMGVTTKGRLARKEDGIFALRRMGVLPFDGLDSLAAKLKNQ